MMTYKYMNGFCLSADIMWDFTLIFCISNFYKLYYCIFCVFNIYFFLVLISLSFFAKAVERQKSNRIDFDLKSVKSD